MIETEIREAIAAYVAGDIDVDALEERVAVKSWPAGGLDREVAALSAAVTGAIAELDAGAITEDDVLAELAPLATPWASPPADRTQASSEIIAVPEQAVAGTASGAARA